MCRNRSVARLGVARSAERQREGDAVAFGMNFWIYLVGIAVVIGGIAWGLAVAHVATTYIMIVTIILLGLGIMAAVTHMRQKDPPE
jgi:predicted MFS family arabinose efflux permease